MAIGPVVTEGAKQAGRVLLQLAPVAAVGAGGVALYRWVNPPPSRTERILGGMKTAGEIAAGVTAVATIVNTFAGFFAKKPPQLGTPGYVQMLVAQAVAEAEAREAVLAVLSARKASTAPAVEEVSAVRQELVIQTPSEGPAARKFPKHPGR